MVHNIIEDYWNEIGIRPDIGEGTEEEMVNVLIDSHRRQREIIDNIQESKKIQTEYFRRKELDESIDNLYKVGFYDYFIVGDIVVLRDGIIIKDNSGFEKVRVDKDFEQFTHNNNSLIKSKEYIEYIKEALTHFLWKKENELKILTQQIVKIRSIE